MDCVKVGNLILELRKEKEMTQKQLADVLHISDKTVSKWERGQGCPDVSLLHQLSEVFNVTTEKILLGDLDPSNPDGGNMDRTKFYMCETCGNIMTSIGEAEISCCGRKLTALTPRVADQAHRLTVEEIEYDYYVTFDHEMKKDHYINFLAYVSINSVLLIKLYPEQSGEVRFPKMHGGKLYYGCSKHGLWVNE